MNKTILPINYAKVKRKQSGNCNICGNPCHYTWDHVPPQGGVEVRALDQYTILECMSEFEETKPDEAMREFVLNPHANLPSNLNVFYWVYPYPHVVAIRDVAMLVIRGKFSDMAVFSILKYFPIAYLVTDLAVYENLPSLSFYCPKDLDEEIRIPINLSSVRAVDWPETVDDGNLIAGGGSSRHSSIVAVPKGTKIRRPQLMVKSLPRIHH